MFAVSNFAQSQPQPQSTIKGKVRWHGRGLSDCPVFIWSGWSGDIPQYTTPVKTDREGNFRQSVPAGNYVVWVTGTAFYVTVDGHPSTQPFQLGSDGTFLVRGLTAGTLNFQFALRANDKEPPLRIARTELEGSSNPIEIKSGDKLTGVKLVLVQATSSIRGRIQLTAGFADSQIGGSATLYLDKQVVGWANVDPTGNFLIENVPAGSYRLVINVNVPGTTPQSTHGEQPVELTPNQVSQVTVWLNPQPIKTPAVRPNQQ